MGFFELTTPRDMLNKAYREHARLKEDINIDTVFNFMVTASHVEDYVKEAGFATQLESFRVDQDIVDCRMLCNKGKHATLRRGGPVTRVRHSQLGLGMLGDMVLGRGTDWLLQVDGRTVEIESLAERVLQKWESLFDQLKI